MLTLIYYEYEFIKGQFYHIASLSICLIEAQQNDWHQTEGESEADGHLFVLKAKYLMS